VQSWETHCGC